MTEHGKKSTVRPCRPDAELKKLAQDLVANKIFMSDQIKRPEDLGMVFSILLMMGQEAKQKLVDEGVVIVYEYLDKALPRGINGYPMFISCGTLTWGRVRAHRRLREEDARCDEGGAGGVSDL